jgi:cell division control protein 6
MHFTATRRNASTSHVPSVPETPTSSGSAVSPPTPPQSPLTPLVPIHTRVRALLRPSCSGVSIAGRDKEREAIRDFVGSFESDDVPTTLYISGSPGSGKTALVNAVLDMLDKSDVRIMPINCMALSGIDELWERLLEDLDGGKKKTKTKPASTKEAVERLFTNLKTRWYAPRILFAVLA